MTRRAARFAYLLVLAAFSAWGCVSQVALEGSPCPCGPESGPFVCCDGMCVGAGTGCKAKPGPNEGDGGVADTHEVTSPDDGGLPEVRVVKSPFIQIAIGRAHACGVRLDGTISCRGDDSKGQASPPPGLFKEVVAGGDHTCGLILDPYDLVKDDSWTCWGDDSHGESTVPPDRFMQVVAGERHNCGLVRDSGAFKLKCWGDDSSGQSRPPAVTTYLTSLVAGRAHTCGLNLEEGADARSVVCWGDGTRGQTTVPDFGRDLPEGHFYTLAAAADHTCLIEYFSLTKCWGDNDHGQSTATPSTFSEFSTATGHSCGIPLGGFKSGEILCFGSEWGDSTSTPPPGKMIHVVAGDWLNCGIPSDDTQPTICWGQTYEPWY